MIYGANLEEEIAQLLCRDSRKQMHWSMLIFDLEGCWKADVLSFFGGENLLFAVALRRILAGDSQVMYKHRQGWYPSSRLTPSRKVIKQIYQNVKLNISSQPLTDRCWCRNWQPWHPNETNIQFSKWIVLQSCQKRHTKDDGSLEIQRLVQKCWGVLCVVPAAVTRNGFVAGNQTVSPPVGTVEWKEMYMIRYEIVLFCMLLVQPQTAQLSIFRKLLFGC